MLSSCCSAIRRRCHHPTIAGGTGGRDHHHHSYYDSSCYFVKKNILLIHNKVISTNRMHINKKASSTYMIRWTRNDGTWNTATAGTTTTTRRGKNSTTNSKMRNFCFHPSSFYYTFSSFSFWLSSSKIKCGPLSSNASKLLVLLHGRHHRRHQHQEHQTNSTNKKSLSVSVGAPVQATNTRTNPVMASKTSPLSSLVLLVGSVTRSTTRRRATTTAAARNHFPPLLFTAASNACISTTNSSSSNSRTITPYQIGTICCFSTKTEPSTSTATAGKVTTTSSTPSNALLASKSVSLTLSSPAALLPSSTLPTAVNENKNEQPSSSSSANSSTRKKPFNYVPIWKRNFKMNKKIKLQENAEKYNPNIHPLLLQDYETILMEQQQQYQDMIQNIHIVRDEQVFQDFFNHTIPEIKLSLPNLRHLWDLLRASWDENMTKAQNGFPYEPFVAIAVSVLNSTRIDHELCLRSLELLLCTKRLSSISSSKTIHHQQQKQKSPNLLYYTSPEEYQYHIKTIMETRSRSVRKEYIYSNQSSNRSNRDGFVLRREIHFAKSNEQLQIETEQFIQQLIQLVPPQIYRNLIQFMERYAGILKHVPDDDDEEVDDEAEEENPVNDKDENDSNNDIDQGDEEEQANQSTPMKPTSTEINKTQKKKKKTRKELELEYNVKRNPPLMPGFRSKISRHLMMSSGPVYYWKIVHPVTSFMYLDVGLTQENMNFVQGIDFATCNRYHQSRLMWINHCKDFVKEMMIQQERLVESWKAIQQQKMETAQQESEYSRNLRESQLSARRLATQSKPVVPQYKKRHHGIFEAMTIHDHRRRPSDPPPLPDLFTNMELNPSWNRVFIDNLPIDMHQDEIIDLYGRCGEVKSVEIFNLRPDLDPGLLSKIKLAERQRKLVASTKSKFGRWQRRQTPVYGIVTFVDQTGYQRAVNDNLRIFGMIYRKHDIRSIPASQMRVLYLDGIEKAIPYREIQTMLSEPIRPYLLIGASGEQYKSFKVGSCEIHFPTFEAAYECYPKLNSLDLLTTTECTLNWIRTPKDAEKWWTRELGFD